MLNRGQRIRVTSSNRRKGHPGVGDEGYICDVVYFLEPSYFLVSAFFFHYPDTPSKDRCEKKFILLDPLFTSSKAKAIDIINPIVNGGFVYSPTKLTERRFTNQSLRLDLSARARDIAAEEPPDIMSYTGNTMIAPWHGRRDQEKFERLMLSIVEIEPINEKEKIESSGQLRAWINAYGPLIAVSASAKIGSLIHVTASTIVAELTNLAKKHGLNVGNSLYLTRKDKISEYLLADKTKLEPMITRIRLLETQMRMQVIRYTMRALDRVGSRFELYSVYSKNSIENIVFDGHLPNSQYEDVFMTLYLAVLFSRVKEEMSDLFYFFGQRFLGLSRFANGNPVVQNTINNLWKRRNELTYLMNRKHFKMD